MLDNSMIILYNNRVVWGRSSLGRALEWHSRGKGFDPPHLHHRSLGKPLVFQGFFAFSREMRFQRGKVLNECEFGYFIGVFLSYGFAGGDLNSVNNDIKLY